VSGLRVRRVLGRGRRRQARRRRRPLLSRSPPSSASAECLWPAVGRRLFFRRHGRL